MALSSAEAKALYERELDRVERIVAHVARRNGLSVEERDEFRSETHLHLLQNDHHVIAAYDGESSFGTYLLVVIQRILLDFRSARWGRWRPSATARRAGATAIRLETLVVRDGRDFGEAVEILRRNHGVTTSREELYSLMQSFPQRYGRASVSHTSLDAEGAPDPPSPSGDAAGLRPETVLGEILEAELSEIEAEDRLLLQLVYCDGLKVSTVSRRLQWNQRSLYSRLERLRRRLKRVLQSRGLAWADLEPLLGEGGPGLGVDLEEIFASCPSPDSGGGMETRGGGPR